VTSSPFEQSPPSLSVFRPRKTAPTLPEPSSSSGICPRNPNATSIHSNGNPAKAIRREISVSNLAFSVFAPHPFQQRKQLPSLRTRGMVPPSFTTTQQPRVLHDLAPPPLPESSPQPVSSIRQHALKFIIPISRRSHKISSSHNLSKLPCPRNQIALFPLISTNIPIDMNRLISYIMSSCKSG